MGHADVLPSAAAVSLTTFAAAPFLSPPPPDLSRIYPWLQVESLREESRRRELELSAAIRDQQTQRFHNLQRPVAQRGFGQP